MRISAPCAILICAFAAFGQSSPEVGAGAPNEFIRGQFVSAYNRGRFASVAGSPSGAVRRFGPTGLIQEFQGTGGTRAALVRSSTLSEPDSPTADVFQILPDLYTYYSSVGVTTAGYPISDTLSCPNAACEYQRFATNHALFVWASGANLVQNITVRDPFYVRWESAGGLSVMGAPKTAEEDVVSTFGSNARLQTFANGALYDITSGQLNGRLVSVKPPIAALYFAEKAHSGRLGLPATEEMILPNGRKRQSFEGGSIEYDSDNGPVVRTPIQTIVLRPATTPVRLNFGETVMLRALPISAEGEELADRAVAFATTNGRVAAITTSGQTVTVRAVGGGTAAVTATAEGKISTPVTFIVTAPCCQIGEGAPTGSISQAMQDAVARNRLNVRVPGPERVRRAGAGYVQEFQSADATATRYLIAISDKAAQAYVVSGSLLGRYEELGGPAGALAFPLGDRTAGGRQLFEGGALAGSRGHLVSGPVLQKWAALSFENGPAGLPSGESTAVTSFSGTAARVQAFEKGLIAAGPKGAFFVGGIVLARYLSLNGALGAMGLPSGDEVAVSGRRRQEFEGGYIEYSPGDSEATAVQKERKPAVSATPSSVLPGSRIRLTVSGFSDGSLLRISSGADPEFRVQTAAGAYSWDTFVPLSAAAGTVRVRAIDATNSSLTAETTYVIRPLSEARARIVRLLGDAQTGAPGAVLPLPLRVAVQDESGNPVTGVPVRFTASPGSEVTPGVVVTDLSGLAETRLRTPATEGVALVTVEALRQVTTFSARTAATSLTGFPKLLQSGSDLLGHGTRTIADAGSMLTAVASMIRHLQLQGALPVPNGMADIATLNNYLKNACTVDYAGGQYCDGFLNPPESDEQIVNLWRLSAFAGSAFTVQADGADQAIARESIVAGLPVLVPITLRIGDVPAGVHYVVATGINADGSLQIHDPNPKLGRQHLNDYINGFTVAGAKFSGSPLATVRFRPGPAATASFLITSAAESISILSAAGPCGHTLELSDVAAGDAVPVRPIRALRLQACEGSENAYQIEIGGRGTVRATITDLAENGARSEIGSSSSAALRASRPGTWLVVGPQEASIATRGIVNAATFTSDIAAGGLIAIFGNGLSRQGSNTTVQIGGRTAAVVAALPFQVNAVVPADVPPGTHIVRVETAYGTVEQPAEIRALAPALFSVSPQQSAIINDDGKLNSPLTPVRRGGAIVMYATGLGATGVSGGFSVTQIPVSASILKQDVPVLFAGLAPGFMGLYQINVAIPLSTPVGATVPLAIRQGGVESRPVEVAIQ